MLPGRQAAANSPQLPPMRTTPPDISAAVKSPALPLTVRIETLRRFGNVVRQRADGFADLLARETGKPLWEARTEIESVIAKVDISVTAYAERTSQRRLDAPMGSRMALRHKPHGVLATATLCWIVVSMGCLAAWATGVPGGEMLLKVGATLQVTLALMAPLMVLRRKVGDVRARRAESRAG